MLSYLKTIESLTTVRDEVRARLEDETRDRQAIAEFAESSLTILLRELVAPDAKCRICGAIAVGVTDTHEGVCEEHVLGALLQGHAANMTAEGLANLQST